MAVIKKNTTEQVTTASAADGRHKDSLSAGDTFQKQVGMLTTTGTTTDWAAKDRSQLVEGRSHDAAKLVDTALVTGTPLAKVLEMYKEALEGVLKVANEVK